MERHQKIPQVAILVATANEWGRRIIQGILSYANEVGPWHVWIMPGSADHYHELPKGWRGDGVIARVDSSRLARELTESGLPVVNVADTKLEGFSAPCIRADDAVGVRMAVEHFVVRGMRNIAFVGPVHKPNPAWCAKAFQKELSERGLPCSVFPVKRADTDWPASLTQWLHSLPKPVGILVWGEGYAREVVDCCMEAGIPVPHDVAVLSGSHDSLLCRACFPALSGILSPTDQIGYQAARLLHEMMRGKDIPHETIYLPPTRICTDLSTDTLAIDDHQLSQVVRYIRDHAFESIKMTDVLRAVPMARRSLERRFQQAFGRSPSDEIRRLRINRARKLLAETRLPMQEIAEACGYATYNYLTHVFKQETGMTPRDYRQQARA